ncbi:MAG: DNA alkylation repair protein [Tahibacter sp.]
MNVAEVVAEMQTFATAQTKKMWITHGAQEPCLGVKVEDMKKIQKRIKKDYKLALDLYDTGIADAMYLAGLIADDAKMTKKDLQKWIEGASWGTVAQYTVPWVASESPYGREMALKWIDAKDKTVASGGWGTYASLVSTKSDAELDLEEIKSLLQRVAKSIHQQPNPVKVAMNGFIINVGAYVKTLNKIALATAKEIGPVTVDLVGACKLSFAPDQIKKMEARGTLNKKRKSAKC